MRPLIENLLIPFITMVLTAVMTYASTVGMYEPPMTALEDTVMTLQEENKKLQEGNTALNNQVDSLKDQLATALSRPTNPSTTQGKELVQACNFIEGQITATNHEIKRLSQPIYGEPTTEENRKLHKLYSILEKYSDALYVCLQR